MMKGTDDLRPGPSMRRPGAIERYDGVSNVHIRDERLGMVLARDTPLLLLHEGTIHGEGPTWQPSRERLIWSDVPNRRLLAWYADGRVEVVIEGAWFMNGNALVGDDILVHCEHGRRCISRSDTDGVQPVPIVTHYRGRRLNSPNDVTVAADGTIWFTDPVFGIVIPAQGCLADPELDHRSVYRFDPTNGDLARMADLEQPNGIAFSSEGTTLYVSDTSLSLGDAPGLAPGTKREVIAFDVGPNGALSNRRFFCEAERGVPDGFAVDRRGWLWVCTGDGVHVWSAERERLGFIPTPCTASNCTFGGADGRRLFIAATRYLFAIDLVG